MADLDGADGEAQSQMSALQKIADAVKLAPTLQEKKDIEQKQWRAALKKARASVTQLRAEVRRSTEPTQKTVFDKRCKTYEATLKELETAVRGEIRPSAKTAPKKSFTEAKHEELMGEGGADGSKFENEAQVLNAAVRVKDDTLQSLQRSERLAATTEDVGRETLHQLQLQTEKLYKIDEELDNLQGELDRASRDVKWFARQMVGDKCFLSIFGFLIIAFLVLVFYSIYSKRKG